MHMSGESLLIVILVGIIAGWLAGQIMRGAGFGLVGDLIIGIIGAFIGSWLLPQLGIRLGAGMVAATDFRSGKKEPGDLRPSRGKGKPSSPGPSTYPLAKESVARRAGVRASNSGRLLRPFAEPTRF